MLPQAPPITPPVMRTRTLYFVRIDTGGTVFVWPVKRELPTNGAPLSETIKALLAGPNDTERKDGVSSLVPTDTRLLGARVEAGTAFLNFDEAFLFNKYGAEGYLAQLRQIIWTATEFPSVSNVQIMIAGKRRNFIGDNIRIDQPLDKNSFSP
jgi:spore germination protein GerM